MKSWIAYEHDETGWRTDALLSVLAETQVQAQQLMAAAITARRATEKSPEMRARLSEIFIEAPTQLFVDDLHIDLVSTGHPIFIGFD